MERDKPDWCAKIDCPYFRNGTCEVRTDIIDNTVTQKRRNKIYQELRELAQTNPDALLEKCRRILGSINSWF